MPIRVLKIIHTLGHGGAENVFRGLAWQLKNDGLDVVGAIPLRGERPGNENWVGPALDESGVAYVTYDKRGSPLDLLRNMKSVIRETRPDIVHSHLLDSNVYSSIACKMLSIPHVCTEHGDVLFNNSISGRVKFVLLTLNSRAVVCVSHTVREAVAKKAFDLGKTVVIHNGIRFPEAGPSKIREELGIPGTGLLIGNVANLYPIKGQRFLVQAFGRLLQEFPDSYLVLVGRGGERDTLENLARQLRIPHGHIIMTGFRNDVGNILAGMDIYVQPSLSEGLPVALLEAMSSGIPVIATDVGGVREILEDGRHGVLVAAGSPDLIHDGLRAVARNIEAYKRKAQSVKQHVRQRFSLQEMARHYIETYERVLAH